MSDRKAEVDEMDQFELLDLLEQVRDLIFNCEDPVEAIVDVKKLLGEPEDWEGDEEDSSYFEEPDEPEEELDDDEEPEGLDFSDDD